MKVRILAGICLISLAAPALWAGNFWEERSFQEWNQVEVQTVLTHSAWGQLVETSPVARGHDWGGLSRPESPSETGPLVGSVGDGGRKRGSRPGASAYYVVWSSALTVRRALARNHILMGMATPEQAERALQEPVNEYTLTILGSDMSSFDHLNPTELEERAYLKPKKLGQKVAPVEVKISRGGTENKVAVVMFVFPRKLPSGDPMIRADEKKVQFSCEIKEAQLKIKTSFEPQKMKLNGAPDL